MISIISEDGISNNTRVLNSEGEDITTESITVDMPLSGLIKAHLTCKEKFLKLDNIELELDAK